MNDTSNVILLFLVSAIVPSVPILISVALGKYGRYRRISNVATAAEIFCRSEDDYAKHAFYSYGERENLEFPDPIGKLVFDNVYFSYEKIAAIKSLSFSLTGGDVVGVIGPAGSGKTTLCRLIAGSIAPSSGGVRLDAARIDQYPASQRRRFIGYLPDIPTFAEASVAENIARLQEPIIPEKIVDCCKKAGAHESILKLSNGYDTIMRERNIPAWLRQQIGFSRALYGEPYVVVLDEPNSFQDRSGDLALQKAVRELKSAGAIVVIAGHRPSLISECNLLLVLESGSKRAFGPRDEVLKNVVQNSSLIEKALQ